MIRAKHRGQWYRWDRIGSAWFCQRYDHNAKRAYGVHGEGTTRDGAFEALQVAINAHQA